MTLKFILNGNDQEINADADRRLVDILREEFHLLGTRDGCRSGNCGLCTVIFNGLVMPSCLIPAFRIRGCEIITVEGFSQTIEGHDIIEGFARAGVETCGFCEAAKLLSASALLDRNPRPSHDEILAAFQGIRCRCTDTDSLIEGVQAAIGIRRRRLYGRGT
jgi:carbon-monoxide dehydrogenase small subunit